MFEARSVFGSVGRDESELARADLSPWFNPFLVHFAREAVRCGGEAHVLRENGAVAGLVLTDPVERVATVFSRSRGKAAETVRARGRLGMYADFAFDPPGEAFDILRANPVDDLPTHRFRHRLRTFSRTDRPAVVDLLAEVHGAVNERWFDDLPTSTEVGFLAEVDGRLSGVAWISRVGDHARLHSLTVRPRYRRLGVGTDLLFARLLWARRQRVTDLLAEIGHGNVGSLTIAARGGLRPVGQIFFYPAERTEA
jgi:GNAT superfamily N-acetyltransferase